MPGSGSNFPSVKPTVPARFSRRRFTAPFLSHGATVDPQIKGNARVVLRFSVCGLSLGDHGGKRDFGIDFRELSSSRHPALGDHGRKLAPNSELRTLLLARPRHCDLQTGLAPGNFEFSCRVKRLTRPSTRQRSPTGSRFGCRAAPSFSQPRRSSPTCGSIPFVNRPSVRTAGSAGVKARLPS